MSIAEVLETINKNKHKNSILGIKKIFYLDSKRYEEEWINNHLIHIFFLLDSY